ncbi:lipoyl(octanoyl) transferase [Malassezia yamatoensis]|uniref:lipoyl(octanoyl) transferase n=1 Tax=Malassezia yamatoensis TaxID=253288 RepID=A0AAJ5Z1A4_9BASI|nr:lipoyl(octanoyl) transferase [Malassezia yamatoensis]
MTSCAKAARRAVQSVSSPILCSFIPYRVPYEKGLQLQEFLVNRRKLARAELRAEQIPIDEPSKVPEHLLHAQKVASTDILLLLEHSPVYTLGKRNDVAAQAVAASGLNAPVIQTQRGGLLTYHGPGQLVGYPILDLGPMRLSARCYIDRVQQTLRDTLAAAPIHLTTQEAPSLEAKYTGIWVDDTHKIASIGVHVRHRVTSHGFALNIQNKALEGFRNIVACGLPEVQLTSVEEQLVKRGRSLQLSVPQVAGRVAAFMGNVLNRDVEMASNSFLTYIPKNVDGLAMLDQVLVDGKQVFV